MTRLRTPWRSLGWIVAGSAISCGALALDCPPNSQDPKCKEQLRQEQQRQEQQRQQQLQQQQQRAQQEAQQRALHQQQQQQLQQQQKAQQEAQQKAQQQQQQQKAQQEAQQKAQQEAQQRAQQQKAQQEAQQKAAQQKAAQQKAPPEAQQKAQQPRAPQQTQQQTQQQPAQQQKQHAQQPPPVPATTAKPTQQAPGPTTATTTGKPATHPTAPPTQQTQQRFAPTSPAVAQQPAAPTTPTGRSMYQPTHAPTAKGSFAPTTQAATAPRVPISTTTAVVPRTDKGGYVIQHQAKDGSQVVVTQRTLPGGTVQPVAYKQSTDVRLGTSTRVYSDGHRVVVGRDYQSYSHAGGPTYVTYGTGLRSAMLPGGKPVFRESFTTVRATDGSNVRVIQKTVYVNQVYGRPVFLATPVVRIYEPIVVYGQPAYFYRPAYYEPVFYRPFWVPFAQPVVVNEGCAMCPSHAVAFASPPARYEDPIDLMGDMQLSSAFDEAAVRSDTDSAQYAEVRNEMSELTRSVSARIESDPSLKQQVGGEGVGLQKVQQTMNELAPVQVPEEVRQQVRAQVRLSIAQLQNQHPALVPDVVKSGYAKIYIFQTAAPLNVADAASGEECFINTGDLLGFSTIPTGDSPVAQMKIITSGAQSCQPRQVVNVPLTDLQDMMNAFSERVEDNLKRVNMCVSTPSTCLRT